MPAALHCLFPIDVVVLFRGLADGSPKRKLWPFLAEPDKQGVCPLIDYIRLSVPLQTSSLAR